MVVNSDAIEMPDKLLRVNEEVALYIDGADANSLEFLTKISQYVHYRSAARLMPTGCKLSM